MNTDLHKVDESAWFLICMEVEKGTGTSECYARVVALVK
jgi:hypothetical protein